MAGFADAARVEFFATWFARGVPREMDVSLRERGVFAFGPFRLDPMRRTLRRDGREVTLTARLFDTLLYLVQNPERLVARDELQSAVWGGRVVEDGNLQKAISALRKALQAEGCANTMIVTVPGRGFRFAAPVRFEPEPIETSQEGQYGVSNRARPTYSAWRIGLLPPWIALALGAAAVMAAGYAVISWFEVRTNVTNSQLEVGTAPPHSIAVLPFHDYSDCHCHAALADALTDDLTSGASRIPGSLVIARESSGFYRDKPAATTAEIARTLNVHFLLEGNIQVDANGALVTVKLTDAAVGQNIWAQRFTVPGQRVGVAEDVIRRQLADVLGVQMFEGEGSAAARERDIDPEAIESFYEARSLLDHSETLQSMIHAQRLLEHALAKQPAFVDAAAELAWLMVRENERIDDIKANQVELEEARRLDVAALRLSPKAPLAIAARGMLLAIDRQDEAARVALESALAAEPDCLQVRTALIFTLGRLGLYDAEANTIYGLLRIDPLGSRTSLQYERLGIAYVMLDRPRDALPWLDRAIAGEPEGKDVYGWGVSEWTSLYRVVALQMSANQGAARTELERHNRMWPNRTIGEVSLLFNKAQTSLPSFGWFMAALAKAGMPPTIEEHKDFGVAPVDHLTKHNSYDPTPTQVPGLATIDTAGLLRLLDRNPRPIIVNVGSGAITIPGTLTDCNFDWEIASEIDICVRRLLSDRSGADIVVMATNPIDWNGYNGALALEHAGVPRVTWYRGGEESWAAGGGPYTDTRP